MAELTLCMIVKDEEASLARCLDSVAGLVDSIVVVDTGSTDRTVEIARSNRALVVQHAWNDDFAAARNAALPHVPRAKNRFVLVLDADERLGPGAKEALRAALARPDFDLGLLPLHDARTLDARPDDVVGGRARRGEPVQLPRLLRLTDDLRWEGVVHEQVTTWATRPGRRARAIDAPIVHYGAVPEVRAQKRKADRNRALLERRAQLEPDNPIVRAHLAREYERCGDGERALDEARVAWNALVASARDRRPECDAILPATILAFLSIRRGDLDAAAVALERARGWSDAHPNLELLTGLVHERRALVAGDVEAFAGELGRARVAYERCLALRGRVFAAEILPGACGVTGTTRLATVRLLAGEPRDARELFDSALRADQASVEATLGRCECDVDTGDFGDALRALSALLPGNTPDAWTLAAAAAAALGARDDARLFLERARDAARKTPWIGMWRRGRLGEIDASLREEPRAGAAARIDAPRRASVVIPCFNRLDLLRRVLDGFAREKRERDFQLVLVDDGSDPPVAELVRSMGLDSAIELVRQPNGGRGAALNTGLARASGEVVIFCDSDIVPMPGFVADHVAFHRQNASELATHLGALAWGVDAGLFGALVGPRSNPRLRGGARGVGWTQWFTDNWSFKRSLLASHGLRFDEAYRAWGFEELDLARELQRLGATNTLSARAEGLHLKAATPDGLRASFVRSVPNLLHLARKSPLDPDVRGWLSSWCDERSVERAERAFERLWTRVQELDSERPDAVRDVRKRDVDELSIALSDALFHVGIARGLARHEGLVERDAALMGTKGSGRLFSELERFARRLFVLERRLRTCGDEPRWLAGFASELGWDDARRCEWLAGDTAVAAG